MRCQNFWETLTNDRYILDIVTSGYKIEFCTEPFQTHPRITLVPKLLEKREIIQKEVNSLLEKGAIRPVQEIQGEFISTIFLVPKKTGGMRPIINLKPLNQFIQTIHFKMETLQTALALIQKDDFLTSLDLKDAYFSIPVAQDHKKYLRFLWEKQCYEFQCLPFGLKSSPRVFTKCTKPLIAHIRSKGHRGLIYIDDSLWMTQSFHQSQLQIQEVMSIFQKAGFTINMEKSSLIPMQEVTFLGYLINTSKMMVYLPQEKITLLRKEIQSLLDNCFPKIRQVARVIGLIVSTFPAVYPGPLHYRFLEKEKTQALQLTQSYQAKMKLSQLAIEELNWWMKNVEDCNGKPIQIQDPSVILTTDASKRGWGAVLNGITTSGLWSAQEVHLHINILELQAVYFALLALGHSIHNQHIQVQIDNKSAVAYINHMGGTHSNAMDAIAKKIWSWALMRNNHISSVHIPGMENQQADFLSRHFLDQTEWKLDPQIFRQFTRIRFPPQVDLFTSRLNHQLEKYVSWQPDPQAWRTNAFSISWKNLQAYAFPPFNLITLVLQKVYRDKCTLLLVTPLWMTQPWYPQALELSCMIPLLLPKQNRILTLPHDQERLHPLERTLQLVVWTVCGNDLKIRDFRKGLQNCYVNRGVQRQISNISQHGSLGWAGVVDNCQIPFHHLSET